MTSVFQPSDQQIPWSVKTIEQRIEATIRFYKSEIDHYKEKLTQTDCLEAEMCKGFLRALEAIKGD